jgi:hypothetical protein
MLSATCIKPVESVDFCSSSFATVFDLTVWNVSLAEFFICPINPCAVFSPCDAVELISCELDVRAEGEPPIPLEPVAAPLVPKPVDPTPVPPVPTPGLADVAEAPTLPADGSVAPVVFDRLAPEPEPDVLPCVPFLFNSAIALLLEIMF